MKKELISGLILGSLLIGETPNTNSIQCEDPQLPYSKEKTIYACPDDHTIYFRSGEEYTLDTNADYFHLSHEKNGVAYFYTRVGSLEYGLTYRGYAYNSNTQELTQEFCVITFPYQMLC